MKPLNEYPTPECDRRAEDCEDSCGNPFEGIDSDLGRSLEQRLAACREALADILDCVDGNYKEVADDCRETLAATKTP